LISSPPLPSGLTRALLDGGAIIGTTAKGITHGPFKCFPAMDFDMKHSAHLNSSFISLQPCKVGRKGKIAKMPKPATDPMYVLRDIPGKGKGLIATRYIPMGTRILSEEPIITLPEYEVYEEYGAGGQTFRESLRKQVDALTPDQRQAFFLMHNPYTVKNTASENTTLRYFEIFRANALPLGKGEVGILLRACRVNHACDNNAQKHWNDNIKRHTVHALRDIEKGKEITIYYLGVVNSREARQAKLQTRFGFTCSCDLCSLPLDLSRETDKRLEEILKFDSLIGVGGLMGILSTPLRKLRYVDEQISLYNKQGPNDSGLPRAFLDAAQIAVANGDLSRAQIFFERAAIGKLVLEGSDGSEYLRNISLAQDPSKHELYGLSMKWKTTVDEFPQGLDSGAFEDWLWMREKPQQPGQLVDLRNQVTFPGFVGLPRDDYFDLEYYNNSGKPKRHWLFLAEIVDFGMLLRLEVHVKDVDGKKIPLFFYTDGRGSELERSKIQKGYTVAILYAQYHAFLYSEPGIRHEKPAHIKVHAIHYICHSRQQTQRA
jgi:SET domain